jgi:cell division protein FtsI/penicillin-binding protein 2
MNRIRAALIAFFIFAFIIILRLAYWQLYSHEKLSSDAFAQHYISMAIPSRRGGVYTADGYPLALTQTAYLAFAEPKNIVDRLSFVRDIAPILSMDTASISALLIDDRRVWVPIQHKVPREIKETLAKLSIKGLGFEPEPIRYYPEASMAAHMLGFVGSDQNGNDTGYFGLEGKYDRELRGKEGSLVMEKDVSGAPIPFGVERRIEPENGRDLVLTVNRTIQMSVEQRLAEGIEKYGAKQGSVIIMDPKTGGILGMAAFPSYDPRNRSNYETSVYKNPVVSAQYEPGSTFKAIVMAEGIENGVITPMTTMNETGPTRVDGYDIRTWNNKYNGVVSMTDVLIHSSNVGMVFVEEKLGSKKMIDMIKKYGFGQLTGVDLEDETSPEIRADDDWKHIDLATASFGQGIAVTPIQMIRGISAIANGGLLMMPHVVSEIRSGIDTSSIIKPVITRRVMSEKTAKLVTEMMVAAVDQGEAKFAKPKGYRIAGKTGTAQIPVAGHYDATKTIASFVGFAPADDPKFVMLVTLQEPSSSQWGSETAAPLFFTIARDLFLYYGIAPR